MKKEEKRRKEWKRKNNEIETIIHGILLIFSKGTFFAKLFYFFALLLRTNCMAVGKLESRPVNVNCTV